VYVNAPDNSNKEKKKTFRNNYYIANRRKHKKKMFPKQRALTITIKEVKGTTAKQTHQSKRLKAITLKKDRG
jgi:hypothetical protein